MGLGEGKGDNPQDGWCWLVSEQFSATLSLPRAKRVDFKGRMAHRTLLCLLLVAVVLAKPADEEKKSRVHSEKLSDEEHFVNDEHNVDYDHEAFLGEDEARTFDQLTPEESKDRLSGVNRGWKRQGVPTTQKIKKLLKANYKAMVYGFMDNMDPSELDDDAEGMTYAEMMKRDQRRWEMADKDNDGGLSLEEFTDFLHPEEAEHMQSIVVTETMEDIDKDKDGKISLKEYIGDMYRGGDDEFEPAWVSNERDQFREFRDKDGDGYLDTEEVKGWIIPPDYNHSEAEAKHLIYEADTDGDKVLTKEEILNKYDVFVGSQATDFGEALVRHDEF
nr:calumenin-like [Cherax quadricarinatus]